MKRLASKSLLIAMLLASTVLQKAEAAPACIDVALVMAVDSSASVSAGEYLLQRNGIARAFRDPEVLDAIAAAGRVAVSVLFWGSDTQPKPQSEWVMLDGVTGAEAFARMVENMPRQVSGDTGLGAGLMAALGKFEALDGCALRRIVNVSGDGEETRALRGQRRSSAPGEARDLAEALNVEINALAVLNEENGLTRYFAANVITEPSGFVMEAHSYRDFAVALRRKLVREIGPQVVSELDPERHLPPKGHNRALAN